MTPLFNRLMRDLILTISLSVLTTSTAFPQQTANNTSNTKKDDSPIEITSDRMRSENGGQKIIFSGNVVVVKANMTITSDIMEVYNTPDKKGTEEIVAIGNVNIIRGEKKAKGDRAVYLDQLQKIILTGSPKAIAWEGKDVIEGREMIFLLKKDRFVVNERVRAKLFQKSDKKREPPAKQQPPLSINKLEQTDQDKPENKTLG